MICDCNQNLNNTGKGNCDSLQSVTRSIFAVYTYDNTGARNYIDPSATLNKAYFDALVNHSDPSKRWYPIKNIESFDSVRVEPDYETFPSKKKFRTIDGIRTVKFVAPIASLSYAKKLEFGSCLDISVYEVDKDGSTIGKRIGTDGFLYPRQVNKETWVALYSPANDTTLSKLNVSFDFELAEKDTDMAMILGTSIVNDVNLLSLDGLLNVVSAVVSAISIAGFTLVLRTDAGPIGNGIFAKGIAIANFLAYPSLATSKIRQTDGTPADVALSSVTVTDTGTNYTYTVAGTYVTGTHLYLYLKKNGFDFTAVNGTSIAIP